MTHRRTLAPAAVVAFCLGLTGTPAHAQSLPPPQTLAHCVVAPGGTLDDPVSCALGTFDTASGSLSTSPFVGLSAQAASPGAPGNHGSSAQTVVTYAFQVVGGTPGDIVPILIATSLSTTATEPSSSALSYAFAALTVQTTAAGTATLAAVCTDGTCGTIATAFSGTLRTRVRSGDSGNLLTLQASAAASGRPAAPSRPAQLRTHSSSSIRSSPAPVSTRSLSAREWGTYRRAAPQSAIPSGTI